MQPIDASVPKYFAVSRRIIDRIRQGELKPGGRVPSENELITKYNISNTTARRVLAELEHAGWVTRIRGKGTFVRTRSVERSADKILSFTDNMIQAGMEPSTDVLDIRPMESGYSSTLNGRFFAMSGPVFAVKRLRFADGVPVMLETRYISRRFCPDVDTRDLAGSLYEIYERDYNLTLAEVHQSLSARVLTDRKTLGNFGLDEPVPALVVGGATFCGRNMIFEMEESLYRGDTYCFTVVARS